MSSYLYAVTIGIYSTNKDNYSIYSINPFKKNLLLILSKKDNKFKLFCK